MQTQIKVSPEEYNITFLGTSLKKFFGPVKGNGISTTKIECWVKLYVYVYNFYRNPKNKGLTFFMGNTRLQNAFNNKFHNNYHYKTIQKAVHKLESLGLATIKRTKVYHVENKEFYHTKREIFLNMDLANKIFGIIYKNDDFLAELKSKDCLKKVIRKRPYMVNEAKDGLAERINNDFGMSYKSELDIICEYVDKITSKYADVSLFFNKYKPSFLEKGNPTNKKLVNENPIDFVISLYDVEWLKYNSKDKQCSKSYKRAVKKSFGFIVKDSELVKELRNLGFILEYNNKKDVFIIEGYTNNDTGEVSRSYNQVNNEGFRKL